MRMRALAVVVFLAAFATGSRGNTVRLLRYDATYDNATHSALCVVPPATIAPERARFVCFYAIPNESRKRDDTGRSGKPPRTVVGPDTNFNVWLSNSLSGAAKCTIGQTLTDTGLPSEQALRDACRGATYEAGTVAGTAATFVNDVRKAVTAKLPPLPAPAPAAASVPVQPATQTVPPPAETATTTTPPATDTEMSAAVIDPNTTTHVASEVQQQNAPPKVEEKQDKNPWTADGTELGLLILIAVLAAALFLDRLAQIRRRRQFWKSQLAEETDLEPAPDFESAAVHFKAQRNALSDELADARNRYESVADDLDNIDKLLKAGKGENRNSRIATLIAAEAAMLRLSSSDSVGLAAKDIETRLKEHKSIVDLTRAQKGAANALEYVRESLDLVKAFEKPFFDSVDGPEDARRVTKEIATAVHGLYTTVAAPGASAKPAHEEIAAIRQEFTTLRDQANERQSVIDRQDRALDAARSFLSEQWPDIVRADLGTTIPTLSARMRVARDLAGSVGCATGGGADAVVIELATLVDRERSSSRQTQAILERLRAYLDLPDRDATELNDIIASELGKPTRILRLALSATVPVLRAKLALVTTEEDGSVLSMLQLGEIVNELEAFLAHLWECDGDRLWTVGIQPGFARNWLHRLFRAEAVLRTYFMASRLAELGEMLSVVAWAFRHGSAVSGYEVDRVHLLAPPSSTMAWSQDSPREFRTCPDIRVRVQSVLRTERDGGFAIDVDAVRVRGTNSIIEQGAVVLAKRADWED